MGNPEEPVTYWQALAVAADTGQLYLNSDAAEQCSNACDDYIELLKGHRLEPYKLAHADGWGEFESGKDLRTMFREKAVGGEDNMLDVLQSHIDVVEQMQVVFKKFFTATDNVDETNAADVRAQGPK